MLLKDAVDNLAYLLGKTDDHPFKERLRRDIIVGRSEILRREFNKRHTVSYSHANTLHNLEVEEDKLGYLKTDDSKQKVYKTVEKIPKPIMYSDREPGFIFVGGLDSEYPHTFIRPERRTYRTTKFSRSQTYTYLDGFLFFFDNIKCVDVRAVFGDLLALEKIKDEEGKLCVPEIIITDDIFTGVKRLLLEEQNELGLSYSKEVEVNVDQP